MKQIKISFTVRDPKLVEFLSDLMKGLDGIDPNGFAYMLIKRAYLETQENINKKLEYQKIAKALDSTGQYQ